MLLVEAKETTEQSILEMSNGTFVLCKRIPPMLLKAFDRAHSARPDPPLKKVKVLGKHEVEEPDPLDPDYLTEIARLDNEQAMDFMALALDFVTLLDEDKKEADERRKKLIRWGIDPDDEPSRLEAFALDNPEKDFERLSEELMRLSTVTAKEVRAQEKNFRPDVDGHAGDKPGDAGQPPEIRTEGDPVPGISEEESSAV